MVRETLGLLPTTVIPLRSLVEERPVLDLRRRGGREGYGDPLDDRLRSSVRFGHPCFRNGSKLSRLSFVPKNRVKIRYPWWFTNNFFDLLRLIVKGTMIKVFRFLTDSWRESL